MKSCISQSLATISDSSLTIEKVLEWISAAEELPEDVLRVPEDKVGEDEGVNVVEAVKVAAAVAAATGAAGAAAAVGPVETGLSVLVVHAAFLL